ncbi:Leo1-like protein-domain-containing protein [Limtongia smithiae]|uniref:Leo1-like protein-domain-containing protein n=1 Tax=Limtongia smithiae TaxID=1125753 RepID=UPI0034CD5F9B
MSSLEDSFHSLSDSEPDQPAAAAPSKIAQQQEDLNGLFGEDDDDAAMSEAGSATAPSAVASEHDDDDDEDRHGVRNGHNSDVEMKDVESANGDESGPSRREHVEDNEEDIFGGSDDDDVEGYYNRYDQSQREEDEEPEYETVDMQEMEIRMPQYLPSHHGAKETNIVRVPNFLNVDYYVFDAERYLEEAEHVLGDSEEAEMRRKQLQAEVQNTIRWRYVADVYGGHELESNAKIVRWSDGSYSLKLGSEIFDIQHMPVTDTYYAVSHDEHEIIQFHSKIANTLSLVPSSMSSLTHMRLSSAIARGQVKVRSVNDFATVEDPEKMKRDAEKAEESKLRARKKLDNKRRQRENRYNYDRDLGGVDGGAGGVGSERKRQGYGGNNRDDDDDGMDRYGATDRYERDDFVVSDDEDDEDEEGADRLRRLKKQGADKYRQKGNNDEDDEEDDEDEEEDAQFTDEEERSDREGDNDADDDELDVPQRDKDLKRRREPGSED